MVCSRLPPQRQKKDGGVAGCGSSDRIKYLGRKFISAGEIRLEDLEDLIEMHKIYHDTLDGNGYLDSVMKAVNGLKIRE